MTMPASQNVTQLLLAWAQGNEAARDELIPLVYDTLRRIARNHLRGERPGHTLQTTALINEVYLRLIDQSVSWQSRAHFFGIAARLMRQVLVDYARARSRNKRGGDQQRVSLSVAEEGLVTKTHGYHRSCRWGPHRGWWHRPGCSPAGVGVAAGRRPSAR